MPCAARDSFANAHQVLFLSRVFVSVLPSYFETSAPSVIALLYFSISPLLSTFKPSLSTLSSIDFGIITSLPTINHPCFAAVLLASAKASYSGVPGLKPNLSAVCLKDSPFLA